jgi:hypothetical protein
MLQISSQGKTSQGQGAIREEQKAQTSRSTQKAQEYFLGMNTLSHTLVLDLIAVEQHCIPHL